MCACVGGRTVNNKCHYGFCFSQGELFVTSRNYPNDHVAVLNASSGSLRTHWGKRGSGDCEFNVPWCICASADERTVFVADYGNSAIKQFTRQGEHVRTINTDKRPVGVCVHKGLLYSSHWQSNEIRVHDAADGSKVSTIKLSAVNENISRLTFLCIVNEQIIFADSDAHTISIWSLQGELIRQLGGASTAAKEDGKFNCVFGVASDGHFIYACDRYNDRVQILSLQGEFIGKFDVKEPRSICVTDDKIFVGCDDDIRVFCKQLQR